MDTSNKKLFEIPIVYGNISYSLGKKVAEGATHKWIAYVRGPKNEDLSYLISKVVFHLHASFTNSVRTVHNHPFVLEERGWGEFDMVLKIHFKDPETTPLEICFTLRLYPFPNNTSQSTKKPVVSEFYDEIIFVNPTSKMKSILDYAREQEQSTKMFAGSDPSRTPIKAQDAFDKMEDDTKSEDEINVRKSLLQSPSDTQLTVDISQHFTRFDESDQKNKLENALAYVHSEIKNLKNSLFKLKEEAKLKKLQL